MSEIFTHRCAARGDDGRENCHATNEWELVGGNACSRCGHVPDATWRRNMGAKMGLNVDALDAAAAATSAPDGEEEKTEEAETATPPTRGTGRRGRGQ